jgi:CRISPR system Cascade subunit CasA
LRATASDVFETAAEAAPRTEIRRIRARVRARAFFDGQMGKWMQEVRHGE